MRNNPVLTVSEKAERSLRNGHLWVYGEEDVQVLGKYGNGDIVDVHSIKGKYLGSGFVNDNSKIRVRIISRNTNDKFDDAFWERRVRYAVDYRLAVMGEEDFCCCRLIFAEADGIPGLSVDRFDNMLVCECLCLGTELRKNVIYDSLLKVLGERGANIKALYERNDSKFRELEGMDRMCGFYSGEESGRVTVKENGIYYAVDYIDGQKTGFFLDQKYNRMAIRKIANKRRVLDCFTHTGAFALNAAAGGALQVTAADISSSALERAGENIRLNCMQDKIKLVKTDVFEYLSDLANMKAHEFDFIILDPPAFTKSRHEVKDAIRGYKEINLKAMKILRRGDYLATCSCSHFVTDSIFCRMLNGAAQDAGISLRQIEGRQQSPDHPILWGVPETEYLKFYIFQIV